MASKKMVCPCLKVTKDDIINAVEQGASSFKDVKKQTRIVSKCGKCKDRVKCFVREVFVEKGLLPEEEKKEKTKKKKKAVNDSGNICISCENGSGDCPLQNENTGKSKEDKKPVQEKKNKAKKNKVKKNKVKNKKDKKNKDKKNKDKKNKERKSKKGKNTSSI